MQPQILGKPALTRSLARAYNLMIDRGAKPAESVPGWFDADILPVDPGPLTLAAAGVLINPWTTFPLSIKGANEADVQLVQDLLCLVPFSSKDIVGALMPILDWPSYTVVEFEGWRSDAMKSPEALSMFEEEILRDFSKRPARTAAEVLCRSFHSSLNSPTLYLKCNYFLRQPFRLNGPVDRACCELCRFLNGTVRPLQEWKRFPLHFDCRCSLDIEPLSSMSGFDK